MSLIAWFRAIQWPGWLLKLGAALVLVLGLRGFWRKQGADDLAAQQNEARLKSAAAARKDYEDAQNLTDEELGSRLTRTDARRVPPDER
ncbi:MAG: hypothetical protein WD046_13810 [Paracoccaceae bacterium]